MTFRHNNTYETRNCNDVDANYDIVVNFGNDNVC